MQKNKKLSSAQYYRSEEYIAFVYSTLQNYFAPQGQTPPPLQHKNPEQLAVAVILSAQCTDAQVNKVTPALFARFPDLFSLATATQHEVEELIYSTGFYRHKAAHLISMAQEVSEKYNGKIPPNFDQLVQLAGIGRKTANVIMNQAFHKAVGIVVDTHVLRISGRLGMSRKKNAIGLEKDLMSILPRPYWLDFSLLLIFLGREFCRAKNPRCGECILQEKCPAFL